MFIHVYIYIYVHTCYIDVAYAHTHTYIHACMHTCMHVYIHTQTSHCSQPLNSPSSLLFSQHVFADICKCCWTHEKFPIGSCPRVLFLPRFLCSGSQ